MVLYGLVWSCLVLYGLGSGPLNFKRAYNWGSLENQKLSERAYKQIRQHKYLILGDFLDIDSLGPRPRFGTMLITISTLPTTVITNSFEGSRHSVRLKLSLQVVQG